MKTNWKLTVFNQYGNVVDRHEFRDCTHEEAVTLAEQYCEENCLDGEWALNEFEPDLDFFDF